MFHLENSIKVNVCFENEDLKIDNNRLNEALKFSYFDKFISNLPKQHETVIGENGVRLSGGEKQRISIARAIIKNAPIVLLDEATSSLDNRSEALIQEAVEKLMEGRTTFIVAHRLSTIHKADQIIVLEKGRIVETGQHEELMNNKNLYYNLYKLKMQDPVTLGEK